MAPPINVQDWYGDRHTCQIASGALDYGSQWGNFCILADISATRARIYTKFYLYRDNVCLRAPSRCGVQRPLGEGGGENGGGLIRAADSYHLYFSQRCQMSNNRAQTCAHSGVEPSRSAKAFLQGGPKSSKKFRIFHHLETLRPYISETIKNRGI